MLDLSKDGYMRFGDYIRTARQLKNLTINEASVIISMDAVRIYELEEHITESSPNPYEVEAFVLGYNIEEVDALYIIKAASEYLPEKLKKILVTIN